MRAAQAAPVRASIAKPIARQGTVRYARDRRWPGSDRTLCYAHDHLRRAEAAISPQ
jgi:hypothetical protein